VPQLDGQQVLLPVLVEPRRLLELVGAGLDVQKAVVRPYTRILVGAQDHAGLLLEGALLQGVVAFAGKGCHVQQVNDLLPISSGILAKNHARVALRLVVAVLGPHPSVKDGGR
jgi:hypothetical protein